MAENHIHRLTRENAELRAQLAAARAEIAEAMRYYSGPKFQGADNDYAHVTTDVTPRLRELLSLTIAD